jgi:uncharacterized membrane protein
MVLATSPDHPRASRDQIPLTHLRELRDELMVALVGSVALAVILVLVDFGCLSYFVVVTMRSRQATVKAVRAGFHRFDQR